jgi:lysosome membrane protein 2
MSIWSTDKSNMINGTDGTLFAPFVNKTEEIQLFMSDLCRSFTMGFNGTMETHYGIELYGFTPSEFFFANATVNPDNAGYCTPPGNCLPAGVMNLTQCVQGVPIIMSCPHFLYAAEKFGRDTNMSADIDKHGTTLWLEPLTGTPMKAHKRIQFNMEVFKDPKIDITAKLPEVVYPLFWIDEVNIFICL